MLDKGRQMGRQTSRVSRRVESVPRAEPRRRTEVSGVMYCVGSRQREEPPVRPDARCVSTRERCVSDQAPQKNVERSRDMSIEGIRKTDTSSP